MEAFLSNPEIQRNLGVDPAVFGPFTESGEDVYNRFIANVELAKSSTAHVAALLERGVPVLVYVGDYDFIANWVGINWWTLALEWSGRAGFVGESLRSWGVDGKEAGKVRSHGGFTFATVHAAGHLVRSHPKKPM